MTAKLTTEQFIEKAKSIHGDKYDYSKVKYINSKEKVTITCSVHGDFYQIPNSHILGYCCRQCSIDNLSNKRRSNREEFIKKARDVHGEKYDYSKVEYKNAHTKVTITCPDHGDFEQTPGSHINGSDCNKCSIIKNSYNRRYNIKKFIEKAKSIHGDKYDYSKVEYKDSYDKVTIICPVHGDFKQTPNAHLNKQGCPKCADERKGFWNPSYIEKHHPDRLDDPCTLYIIECSSDEERFIKIGITTKTLVERYKYSDYNDYYQYKSLLEHCSTLLKCAELEQEILNQYKDYQYDPKYKFGGSSECLNIEALDSVIKENFE